MKRTMIIVVALSAALLSSACSVSYEFVIVNESDAPLEVKYILKPSAMPPHGQIEVPAVLSSDRLSRAERPWVTLPYERYHIDHGSGHVTVRLGPHEALRVADIMNYSGHESEYSESRFPIASLSLNGARGSVSYEGRQAMTQFVKSDSAYLIKYW
jgi:hypothetical protein